MSGQAESGLAELYCSSQRYLAISPYPQCNSKPKISLKARIKENPKGLNLNYMEDVAGPLSWSASCLLRILIQFRSSFKTPNADWFLAQNVWP
ncbi:hypothetical protein AVEN_20475-1 [Araneus ventricosus]|uniref:Uncharacterized protein n=1 Tax=Araneus ventricosus TaxID=182803 RepID=A0A4Y2KPT0_ARAVE|nr:hypothetical protein AVEN_20475-1 [Araneus ventricosus]